ncbi:cell division ATP-binding protein FtsE, partial [Sesbania bispinosa]
SKKERLKEGIVSIVLVTICIPSFRRTVTLQNLHLYFPHYVFDNKSWPWRVMAAHGSDDQTRSGGEGERVMVHDKEGVAMRG